MQGGDIRSCDGPSMPATTCMDIVEIMEALESVRSLRGFYELIRHDVRRLIPHEMTCFCVGEWTTEKVFRTHALVGVDWPENYFNEILAHEDINYLMKTPARASGDFAVNYFDVEAEETLSPADESSADTARKAIRNIFVQSMISPHNSKSIYHCFANNSVSVDVQYRRIVKLLLPHFNKAILRLTEQDRSGAQCGITEREMCVLRYLTLGYKNRNIAEELNISIHTVKNHITNILSKLHVVNRTQAVTRAMELRLSNELFV